MRQRLLAVALVALAASSVASSAASTAARQQGALTVYAAASLTEVFSAYDRAQRYNFAGSNALETQIRNGAPADIFASAAPLNTQRLFQSRLVERPVTFTSNRLVLIVPRSNPAGIQSVYDLRRKQVKLVVAGAAVPVGGYTRTVLRQDGAELGALQGRQPGVRREGRHGKGGARPGRRGLRLRDGRPTRRLAGHGHPHPRLGTAADPVRDRRRGEVGQQGGRPRLDQTAALAQGAEQRCSNAGFLPIPKASP